MSFQDVKLTDIYASSDAVQITNFKNKTVIRINGSNRPDTFHIMYRRSLNKDRRFFFVEVNELGSIIFTVFENIITPKLIQKRKFNA